MGRHRLSVIASVYWNRVTNTAFTAAVIVGLLFFCIARFELIPITGITALFFEIMASVGGAVVIGLMVFGFLGRKNRTVSGCHCAAVHVDIRYWVLTSIHSASCLANGLWCQYYCLYRHQPDG